MMRFCLLLLAALPLVSGRPSGPAAETGLESLLTRAQYENFFPHHHPLYSFEALIKAATGFPSFTGEGDLTIRKRELAAFFAEIAHETTNGGAGAPGGAYAWGLYYTEELGCGDGHCRQYNSDDGGRYKAATGKTYYGRGPIQLSYPYNYGQAGADLKLPLLAHPELVSHDGVVAFRTALWFWMREDGEPSCHAVMTGKWQPDAEDRRLGRQPGFGMTINIINGNVECHTQLPAARKEREDRIGHYRYFAGLLQVPVEKDCDCAAMTPYGQ
ncbi:MAG TPA: chitinase [Puia sp.]|nr:chitinase [Puia sp.]